MSKQQPKLSCGLDTINNKVVKKIRAELATPMEILIGHLIEEDYVLSKFRNHPTIQDSLADEYGNYHPVSLLSALSKILEKVCV